MPPSKLTPLFGSGSVVADHRPAIPYACCSPAPPTVSDSPQGTTIFALNGSSGVWIEAKLKAVSVPVGFQSYPTAEPSGVNSSKRRFGRGAVWALALSSGINGPAAAPRPRPCSSRRRDTSNRNLRAMMV